MIIEEGWQKVCRDKVGVRVRSKKNGVGTLWKRLRLKGNGFEKKDSNGILEIVEKERVGEAKGGKGCRRRGNEQLIIILPNKGGVKNGR